MLSIAERHKYILDSLNKHGFVRITDVANELGVTKVTIRKDIKILESKGLLYKVHGSARPANPHVADLDVHVKDNINRDAKRRIAQRAAEMLGETDSIIVASGSTVYAFAEEIKMRMWHHLNIVTPFLRLGVLLNESENVNVVQLGGSVHKKSLSVLGEEAARELDDCICSKVFFGVDGIDPEHGITTSTIDEAKLTRRMMHAASQVIVLADSSKFGQRGFGRICALEDIDVIVTDERLLNESENVNVVQLGGSVHKKSLSVLGEEAARELDDCICSKVFFGVDGIDPEHGITTSTIDEAKLTRRMMHAASQVIVLADSSKFGQRGFGRICALEDIDVIVTDERIPEQMISIIEEAGVDLIIVR